MEHKTRKPKYFLFVAVFVAQVLCINIAHAAEWLYVECSNIKKVGDIDLPSYVKRLPSIYWGTSVADNSKGDQTDTNLGKIPSIRMNTSYDIIYPLRGSFSGDPTRFQSEGNTEFTIIKNKNKDEYTIQFTTQHVDIFEGQVTGGVNSLADLTCKETVCRCKKPAPQEYKAPTHGSAPHDPEEGSSGNKCSCAIS